MEKMDFGFIKLLINGIQYLFGSKCNHEWFDTHTNGNQTYQQCYWCDGTRKNPI